MASKSPEQRTARAIQDFATYDGEVVLYTKALRFVRSKMSERVFGERPSEFAARLWLAHRAELLSARKVAA